MKQLNLNIMSTIYRERQSTYKANLDKRNQ